MRSRRDPVRWRERQGIGAAVATAVVLGIVAAVLSGHGATVLVALGIAALVAVHELAHLVAARRAGMLVQEAALGLGPVVARRRTRNGTPLRLRALPLGGFVRIAGMSERDVVAPEDEPRTYRAAPARRRIVVALAGPLANLAAALVLAVLAGLLGLPERSLTVRETLPGSPAAAAGLRPGDVVTAVDGVTATNWDQIATAVAADRPVTLRVRRGAEHLTVTARPMHLGGRPVLGARPTTTTHPEPLSAALGRAPGRVDALGRATLTGFGQAVGSLPALVRGALHGDRAGSRPVSGIGAVRLGALVSQDGAGATALLLARISLALALVNLVPLPPLDGGLAAVAAWDGLGRWRRRRGSRRAWPSLPPVAIRVVTVAVALVLAVGGGLALVADLHAPLSG